MQQTITCAGFNTTSIHVSLVEVTAHGSSAGKTARAAPRHHVGRRMRRALRDAVVRLAESPRGTPPASPVDACLEPILELASGAYERWCNVRRQLYASGALPIGRVDAPVISVGNVTWGGCGKTPMAEWVARECAAFGAAPAVLSRGYRGGDEAWMLRRRLGDVRGARVMVGADRLRLARDALGGSTARVGASWRADGRAWDGTGSGTSGRGLGAGLNAFAYETKFAGDVDVDDVELRCAEDQWRGGSRGRGGGHRVGGGHGAEAASAPGRITAVEDPSDVNGPRGASIVNIRRHGGGSDAQTPSDVFVLDDGMQHLRLARDLEVVMVNALAKWGNGRLVPRGPLREHPSLALRRADVVALHHHRPIGTNRVHPRGGGAEDEGEDDAGAFEREVRSHMSPGALLVKTRMRPVRIERLARYLVRNDLEREAARVQRTMTSPLRPTCGVDSPGVRVNEVYRGATLPLGSEPGARVDAALESAPRRQGALLVRRGLPRRVGSDPRRPRGAGDEGRRERVRPAVAQHRFGGGVEPRRPRGVPRE